jgi:RNase P subunit RPR2
MREDDMTTCPHCLFPLTGKVVSKISSDTSEYVVMCTHCEAVLRIQVTTLRDPTKKVTNKIDKASTYCSVCQEVMIVGQEDKHECSFYRKKKEEKK